jgi:hypothetical protein
MDDTLTREMLDEVLSALERLETQNTAVFQFLRDQKKGADKLAPYLEQAEKASSVKWMATRARLNHLLDGAAREAERAAEKSADTQTKSALPAKKVEKDEDSRSEDNKSKAATSAVQSEAAPPEKPERVEASEIEETEKAPEPGKSESASRTDDSPEEKRTDKQSAETIGV